MTDLTADDTVDRVVQSLQENSASFERERHSARTAKFRQITLQGLVFAAGLVAGLLIH
jgi:hypothetical protein